MDSKKSRPATREEIEQLQRELDTNQHIRCAVTPEHKYMR